MSVFIEAGREPAGENDLQLQASESGSSATRIDLSLHEAEERQRLILTSVRDYAIYTLDSEGRISSWNPGAEAIKGYVEQEIIGKHFSRFYTQEAQAAGKPARALKTATEEGRFEDEEWRIRKDGTRFWANVVITPLREKDGRLLGFVKVVRDLTQRHEAEQSLRRQTEIIRLLRDIAVAANEAQTMQSAMQFALERICEFTGWKVAHGFLVNANGSSRFHSMNLWHIDEPDQFYEFRKATEQINFAEGSGLPGVVLARHTPLWVEDIIHYPDFLRAEWAKPSGIKSAIAFPLLVGKRVEGVLEFFSSEREPIDPELLDVMAQIGTTLGRVVERLQSESALRRSENRFRTIFSGAGLGIQMVDMEGRTLESNPALCRMLGYAPDELCNATSPDHPANLLGHLSEFKEMQAGSRKDFFLERPFSRKDGSILWGRVSVSLLESDDRQPEYAVAMLEDISERKTIEIELAELQRRLMEGRELERQHLAQQLHDGPVQDLYGLSYHLKLYLSELSGGEEQPVKVINNTMQQVIRTLRSICSDLRPATLTPFGLEKAIRSHADVFEDQNPELWLHMDLAYDDQALPEQVRLALFRIYQQALNNIVQHASASQIWVKFEFDDKEAVFEVRDDGIGFELPSRWIEMARQGHLGLVSAAERIEAIGGRLEVDSDPGQGTTVRAVVPLDFPVIMDK